MTHNHITHKHLAAASPVALALGMLAFSAAPAFADTCTLSGTPSVWSLGASGNWSVAGNWAPSGEPNSSSTNVCIVDNTSTVTLNVSATIASLQIASGNSLDMANTLFVNGPSISNGGTITVPGTTLQFEGSTTLSGGGTVQMSSDAFVNESTSGLTLSNASTIEGTGQLGQNGLALTNESGGTVSANVSGGTLTLNGGGLVTNAGLLTATGGGIMTIDNNVANTSGNITASGTTGGTVNLQNAITVTGGTLNTSGNGVVNGENVTLSGVTVSTGSTFTDTDVTKLQGTITNNGTITNPGNTLQVTGGDVTLTGGGTVTMSADAFFNESTTGLTLHNVNNTIEGSGQLGQNGLALDNQSGGTVNANVSGGTLTLNGGGVVTNAGLLTATGGGIMTIDNNVTNTGANITANGGTVNLQNAITVTGGTLNTSGGGVMNGSNVTLSGVTVSTGSTLTDSDLTQLEGTITNNGTITNPNNTLQVTGGDVTLTGGGTVTMSSDAFFNESTGGLTLHNVNNLIEGSGQLGQNGLALDNQSGGTVNANVSGQTLTLNGGGAVTNAGLLTATGGGIMTIDNNVTNTGANITANGGTVNLENAITVTGGTLNTSGGGVMNGQNVTLNGVTVSTGSTLTDTDLTELRGTITNNGTITVPNNTLQVTGGDVTLTGGGTVMMSSDAFLNESTGGLTLHNVNNTIEGSGQLGQNGLALDNQSGGTVNANVSGQTLTLNGGGLVTNAGLLTATGGGIMTIQNNVTNANGNITANGGTVNLESAVTITGGTLNTTGGGVMNGQNVTLNGVTLSTGSTLTDTDLTQLEGTITNNGTITVPNNTLQVTGISGSTVTLTGGGTVQMSSDAFFNQSTGGLTLSNVNNTIEGTGQLGQNGLAIVNQSGGTILANVPGGTLSLNGGGDVTNNGTMQVNAGSTMVVTSPLTNFSGGTLAGGTYIVNGSTGNTGTKVGPSGANAYSQSSGLTKVNGTLTAASVSLTGGTLNGTGSVSGNVFNTGGTVMPGDPPGDLTFDNKYTQGIGGSLDILLGGAVGGTEYSQLLVHQQATLAGTLDLTTVDGFTLTNGDTFDILGTGEGLTNGMTALSFDGTACAPDGTNMYKCTFGSFFDIFTEVTLDPGVLVPGSSPMDLVLNVTVGSVTPGIPEPSTWAMMAIGFAGLGFAGYRKAQRRSVFDA